MPWCSLADAQVARIVPAEELALIQNDYQSPPRGATALERALERPIDLSHLPRTPPDAELLRSAAEYEANQGLLIRWGDFNSVLTAISVAVTTGDPHAEMQILVTGASMEASARTTLTNAGAVMDRVYFIHQACGGQCSVWMRDYGPRVIDADLQRAFVDHTYNRSFRPLDNQVPALLADLWQVPRFELPLIHGGGNFHLFGNGEAFATRLLVEENPGSNDADVQQLIAAYQGLDLSLVEPFPQSYDSTQHIDMWMLPVSDRAVIIGEYAPSEGGGVPRQVSEALTADLQQRGYQVFRTPGWRSGNAHYTYTNSVIFNRLVLLCQFAGQTSRNAQALAVFQQAFPGHQIVPVECGQIINAAGAIHCIVMHVPRPGRVFRGGFEG